MNNATTTEVYPLCVNYVVVLSGTYTSTWMEGEPDGSVHQESETYPVSDVLTFGTAWAAADHVRETMADPAFDVAIGFARVGDSALGL